MTTIIYPDSEADVITRRCPTSGEMENVDAEDLLWRAAFGRRLSVLPRGVRYHIASSRFQGYSYWVVECPPARRAVLYSPTPGGNHSKFFLPMPWQIYVITQNANRFALSNVFFRLSPLLSLDDALLVAGVPNTYNDTHRPGGICAATTMSVRECRVGTKLDIERSIYNAIDAFWLSGFNNDLKMWLGTQPIQSLHCVKPGADLTTEAIRKGLENWEAVEDDLVNKLPYTQALWTLREVLFQHDRGVESIKQARELMHKSIPPTPVNKVKDFTTLVNIIMNDNLEATVEV